MLLAYLRCYMSTRIEIERFFTAAAEELPWFRLLVLAFHHWPQTASLWCITIRTLRLTEKIAVVALSF